MQSTMEVARDKSERLEEELNDKNSIIKNLETDAKSHIIEIKKLKDQFEVTKKTGIFLILNSIFHVVPIRNIIYYII